MSGARAWGGLAGLVALVLGCGRTKPAPATTEVALTWTLEGALTPERCNTHGAALVEIAFTDPSGRTVATVRHRCFSAHAIDTLDKSELPEGARVTLPTGGDYLASARLLDDDGRAVTAPVTATISPREGEPGLEHNFDFRGF